MTWLNHYLIIGVITITIQHQLLINELTKLINPLFEKNFGINPLTQYPQATVNADMSIIISYNISNYPWTVTFHLKFWINKSLYLFSWLLLIESSWVLLKFRGIIIIFNYTNIQFIKCSNNAVMVDEPMKTTHQWTLQLLSCFSSHLKFWSCAKNSICTPQGISVRFLFPN